MVGLKSMKLNIQMFRKHATCVHLLTCISCILTLSLLLAGRNLKSFKKFKFILIKMHNNCCHQSCSFWLRYAPNRLSAGALPQTHCGSLQRSPRPTSWFRGGAPGETEGGRGGSLGMPKSRVGKPNNIRYTKVLIVTAFS